MAGPVVLWERGDCRRVFAGPCKNTWDDGENPPYCHITWSAILCCFNYEHCKFYLLCVRLNVTPQTRFPKGTIVCGVFVFSENIGKELKNEK